MLSNCGALSSTSGLTNPLSSDQRHLAVRPTESPPPLTPAQLPERRQELMRVQFSQEEDQFYQRLEEEAEAQSKASSLKRGWGQVYDTWR